MKTHRTLLPVSVLVVLVSIPLSSAFANEKVIICSNPEQIKNFSSSGYDECELELVCQVMFALDDRKKKFSYIGKDGRHELERKQIGDVIVGEQSSGVTNSADNESRYSMYTRWEINRLTGGASSFSYVYRNADGKELTSDEVRLIEKDRIDSGWGRFAGLPQQYSYWKCVPAKSKF